jgi:hypothetical protein
MKKFSVEINQRDKNLLFILVAVIIAFLLYNFIINPALINGTILAQERESTEYELNRVKTVIAQYPDLKKEEPVEKAKLVNKYKMFFDDLNQERILYRVDTLLINSGFNVSSYALTKTVASQIIANKPVYTSLTYPLFEIASKINPSLVELIKDDDDTGAESSVATDSMDFIPTTELTLSFNNTSYESVMAFLQSVENMDKSLIIKSVSMSKSETGVGGSIILSLYSLPKLDDTDKDLLKFDPVIPKGKANPFN